MTTARPINNCVTEMTGTEYPIIQGFMAGAFAMGAEGFQMSTGMLSKSDSPMHNKWKQAVVAAIPLSGQGSGVSMK